MNAAERAVDETDERTAEKRPLHEFVPERFEQPVHLTFLAEKTGGPKVREIFSSVKTSAVSPKAISSPFREISPGRKARGPISNRDARR